MKNKDSLNQLVLEALTDSGWVLKTKGACHSTWTRTIELRPDSSVERIIKFMNDNNDYPGWTGAEHHKGWSKGTKLVLVSTWDST